MTTRRPRPLLALLLGPLVALASGCAEPVTDAEIAALPAEVPGIPTGPTHRGGQPCPLCHSASGGRNPIFTVAGTLYQKPTNKVPIENAVVHVEDATGTTNDLTTNCAGNFYITDTEWSPTFPLYVTIENAATGDTPFMVTKMGRDGGCGSCHVDPAGTNSPGHVYLTKDPSVPDATAPALTCGRGKQ